MMMMRVMVEMMTWTLREWRCASSIFLPLHLELIHRLCREASQWSRERRGEVTPRLRCSLHPATRARALCRPPPRVNLSYHHVCRKFLCWGLKLKAGPAWKIGP